MSKNLLVVGLWIALAGMTSADEVYMHQYGSGEIYKYSTNSGALTLVGDTVLNGFCALAAAPIAVPKPGGGVWPTGTVFGLERNTGRLWVIDQNDASLTYVGEDASLEGSQGLAFRPNGALYALRDNDEDGEFYQVSTVNGAATYLGFCDVYDLDGLTAFPVDTVVAGFGVAHAGDFLACNGGELYHIDPGTLTATFIGNSTAHQTLDFAPTGTLYSHDFYGGNLYVTSLNPLGDTLLAPTISYVDGMAVVPEPTGLIILATCAALLCGRRRVSWPGETFILFR